MIKSPFLSEFSVGREDLQQFLGFLLREQLQDELLIGSSSGRSLLPLMFCSSFIYLFIHFPLCLKLYRNTVHVCHTTPALYVASIVYCPVCVCTAGLLWPGRGGAAKTAGDDGEQQLWISDARLRQN